MAMFRYLEHVTWAGFTALCLRLRAQQNFSRSSTVPLETNIHWFHKVLETLL